MSVNRCCFHLPVLSRSLRGLFLASLRLSFVVLVAVIIPTVRANAALLYDNGPITDTDSGGKCDQGPTGCLGSGTWTYYDDFNLNSASTITNFDYNDWFFDGPSTDYVTTNWSIWSADPFLPGVPTAAGSTVAVLTPAGLGSQYRFAVNGVSVSLPAGTYWLGINNTMLNDKLTTPATVAHLPANAKQWDGGAFQSGGLEDRAFRIFGGPVPEPSALLLALLSLVAGSCRREMRRVISAA